jgi:hypothetical protein
MEYKYIAPVNWTIPQDTIQKVRLLDPIVMQDNNDLNKNPLYKQVGILFKQDNVEFPVTLTDPFTGEQAIITQEIYNELKHRYDNFKTVLGMDWSPFRLNWIRNELQDEILSFLPNELKALNPRVSRQTKLSEGNSTPVHRDYHRSATLFYLLDQTDDVTSWWEITEPFTEYNFWLWGDVTKMKKVKSVQIQAGQWYLFDVNKYHSVEAGAELKNRNSLCIEFYNPTQADDIYQIFKDLNLI